MRGYRPGASLVLGGALVLGGIALLLVAAALHSRWWLLVAGAALVTWLVLMWFDAQVWRKMQEPAPCPLCNRPLLTGEDQSGGTHHYCLWATSVGHHYGLCGCTGWNDPYLAGLEGERRAKEGTQ